MQNIASTEDRALRLAACTIRDSLHVNGAYVPRHAVPLPSGVDVSAAERGRVDHLRALLVLTATFRHPESRALRARLDPAAA